MKPYLPITDPRFIWTDSSATDIRVRQREVIGRLPTERAEYERIQGAIRAVKAHEERMKNES